MSARAKLISSMTVFGTVGIFVHYIPLPSAFIAMVRGFVGAAFLILLMALRRQKPDKAAIRANLPVLLLSGTAIGINWILLFESYKYTSVATATLCYYLAPMFIILVSPFLFKERLTARRMLCVAAALLGMVFVSGILQTGFTGGSEYVGVFFGLGAAVFYAALVLLNKKLHDIGDYDRSLLQLGTAGVVILPYVLLTENIASFAFTPQVIILLAVVGILHTGVCYSVYFSAIGVLPAQTAAILSYIDPIVAVILSALFLREPLGIGGIIGAVLVLGAAFVSELPEKAKQ